MLEILLGLVLQDAGIEWKSDYAEALKEAKTGGKNVLVHLSTAW